MGRSIGLFRAACGLAVAIVACTPEESADAEQVDASLVLQAADRVWLALDATVTFEPNEEFTQQSWEAQSLFAKDSMRAALAHAAGGRTSVEIVANPAVLEPAAQVYFDKLVNRFMRRNALAIRRASVHTQGVSDPGGADAKVDVGGGSSARPEACVAGPPREKQTLVPGTNDSTVAPAAFDVDVNGGILRLSGEVTLTIPACAVEMSVDVAILGYATSPPVPLADASRCYVADSKPTSAVVRSAQVSFTWHDVPDAEEYKAWRLGQTGWEAATPTRKDGDITVVSPYLPGLAFCLSK